MYLCAYDSPLCWIVKRLISWFILFVFWNLAGSASPDQSTHKMSSKFFSRREQSNLHISFVQIHILHYNRRCYWFCRQNCLTFHHNLRKLLSACHWKLVPSKYMRCIYLWCIFSIIGACVGHTVWVPIAQRTMSSRSEVLASWSRCLETGESLEFNFNTFHQSWIQSQDLFQIGQNFCNGDVCEMIIR